MTNIKYDINNSYFVNTNYNNYDSNYILNNIFNII